MIIYAIVWKTAFVKEGKNNSGGSVMKLMTKVIHLSLAIGCFCQTMVKSAASDFRAMPPLLRESL